MEHIIIGQYKKNIDYDFRKIENLFKSKNPIFWAISIDLENIKKIDKGIEAYFKQFEDKCLVIIDDLDIKWEAADILTKSFLMLLLQQKTIERSVIFYMEDSKGKNRFYGISWGIEPIPSIDLIIKDIRYNITKQVEKYEKGG